MVTGDGVGALDGKRLGDSEGTVEGVVVETDKNLSTFLWPTVLLMRLPQSDSACVRRVLNLDLRSVKRSSRFRRGCGHMRVDTRGNSKERDMGEEQKRK